METPEQRVLRGLGVPHTTAADKGDDRFFNEGMFLQERMHQHEMLDHACMKKGSRC